MVWGSIRVTLFKSRFTYEEPFSILAARRSVAGCGIHALREACLKLMDVYFVIQFYGSILNIVN
jgi:hypothetical protein